MDESYLEFQNAYEKMIHGIKGINIISAADCLSPAAKMLGQKDDGIAPDQSLPPNCVKKSKIIKSKKMLSVEQNSTNNVMEIDGIIIHLGDINDDDDDDDDQSFEGMEEEFGPNVTFTVKTMKAKRLSAFMEVLNESQKTAVSDQLTTLPKPF